MVYERRYYSPLRIRSDSDWMLKMNETGLGKVATDNERVKQRINFHTESNTEMVMISEKRKFDTT